MKAVTCHAGELSVVDIPAPEPQAGQLVLDVVRTGICGSDLHARVHADAAADAARSAGYDALMRPHDTVVFGHEFCGEVAERGPGTSLKEGTLAVSYPLIRHGSVVHPLGLTRHAPGAYADQVAVEAALTFAVPNGLPAEVAALTEPLAVAHHAVRRGQVGAKQVAVVVGCGPIGLAVILMLKAAGVRTVVASDFSAGRRALAERCGADVVLDPEVDSVWAEVNARGQFKDAPALFAEAVSATEKLRSIPLLPWAQVMRAAERLGALPSGPVIFECVGVPGILDQIMASAPLASRIVVVGVCMGDDTIRPSIAINKEIDLRFVLAYTPTEFHETLHMLANGTVDPALLVTGTVGLNGVQAAFDALGDPEKHAKILIDPKSTASVP